MIEPIVARDTIRSHARAAAEASKPMHSANPYPPGCSAFLHWERDYLDWERHLEQQSALV